MSARLALVTTDVPELLELDFPLDAETIDACFDPREFLTRTGVLFDRVGQLEF